MDEHRILVEVGFDASDIIICTERPQLCYALGMTHGYIEADDAAVAPTNQCSLVYLKVIEKSEEIVGHQRVTEGLVRTRTTAVPATVRDDHRMVLNERGDLVTPGVSIS